MKRFLSTVCVFFFLLAFSVPAYAASSYEDTIKTESESVSADRTLDKLEAAISDGAVTPPGAIYCKSAILIEWETGTVLFENNADERLYPASVTKIMTMLLVTEAIERGDIALTDTVTASTNASKKGGSQIWLKEGETMTVNELLLATAVGSANDAATALGEYVGGSEEQFVAMMNARAKELNMTNTNFDNATGLDDTSPTHLSTARDISLMSRELMKHTLIESYTTVWMDSLRGGQTELVNTNKLVRFYSGTTGIKTGTTSRAGCCISASARRDGMQLIAVIMGSGNSNDRFESAKTLLSWGFLNYALVKPEIDESASESVKVLFGVKSSVAPLMPEVEPVLTLRSRTADVSYSVIMSEGVEAPVESGQKIGTLYVTLGSDVVAEYPLCAGEEVAKLGIAGAFVRLLRFAATGLRDY